MDKQAKIENLTSEATNPFGDIIYAYTWDDAIKDGMFVEVTEYAKNHGLKIPVAITRTIYDDLESQSDDDKHLISLINLLLILTVEEAKNAPEGEDMIFYTYRDKPVWAKVEGRSPQNPEPIMTIMYPEDN